ncbi:hypothetical protein DEO23_12515 [Brachybacterium endophyticum]|uniref:DUF8094 domain-containing protein n=1 Tax=Brachybacterium endophyticum TaxID=2182385 RepID=A0A2U2RHQ6_9MICO|nr:hypothetical protein [Brachybacterium endophyticum]PWH05403.1 hypothetical protein DEO23_12515 [Brachybacterium endophyticum]
MSAVTRRVVLSGAGAMALGGLLAACGSKEDAPPAVPSGPELESPTPAVTGDQMSAYLGDIHDALKAADEDRKAGELAPRVTGSAASFRKATYAIIDKDKGWAKKALTRPGQKAVVPITSTSEDFPRTALALVEADGSSDAAPYFMILQQKDAKSPYSTWGWAQQVAGIDMPTVPSAQVGSAAVTADEKDLLVTPKEALELYAAVLSSGDKKDRKHQLADDPFKQTTFEQIWKERRELNKGVDKDEIGTIHEEYTPVKGEVGGLRTDDGGAIVLGTLTSTRKLSINEGSKVSYGEDNIYTTIIGARTFTKEYSRDYGTTVALYIPPKGSEKKIQPIGATRAVLDARGE